MAYVKPNANGQATMANSAPVVIASNQSAVSVLQPDAVGAATQITAVDAVVAAPGGAGTAVSGASTADSYVALVLAGGEGTAVVLVGGSTHATTFYFEVSNNTTTGVDGNWISVMAQRLGINETTLSATHTAGGVAQVYRVPVQGMRGVRLRAVGGTITTGPFVTIRAGQSDNAVVQAGSIPAGTNSIGTTPGPTLTKGTQGTVGHSTQHLKDAGRAIVNASTAIAGVTAVTVEALLSLNVSRDGAATAAATSIAVTSGKRLRILGVTAGVISTAAAVISTRVALRLNPSGAVAATSPVIAILPMSQQAAALAQAGDTCSVMFSEAVEISGTMQVGLSHVSSAATGTVWASLIAYEY